MLFHVVASGLTYNWKGRVNNWLCEKLKRRIVASVFLKWLINMSFSLKEVVELNKNRLFKRHYRFKETARFKHFFFFFLRNVPNRFPLSAQNSLD